MRKICHSENESLKNDLLFLREKYRNNQLLNHQTFPDLYQWNCVFFYSRWL